MECAYGYSRLQFQYPLLLDAVGEGKLSMERAIDMVARIRRRRLGSRRVRERSARP